jgi:hypothetical protein
VQPGAPGSGGLIGVRLGCCCGQGVTTTDLLEVLRPRRNTSLVGAYLVLLGELSERIPVPDLPAVFCWASERVKSGEQAYGRLFRHLVQSGWSRRGGTSLLTALADIVVAVGEEHRELWNSHNTPPWVDADTDSRRQLAVLVAEQLDEDNGYGLRKLELLTESDLDWLLVELPALPTAAQGTLAHAVPYLLNKPTASQADQILALPDDHPAYEVPRSFAAPIGARCSAVPIAYRRWSHHIDSLTGRANEATGQCDLTGRSPCACCPEDGAR